MNRRSFFKRVGAGLVAAVAAPLFIPSERSDFGAPSDESVRGAVAAVVEQRMAEAFNDAVLSSYYAPPSTSKLSWCNFMIDAEELAIIIPIPDVPSFDSDLALLTARQRRRAGVSAPEVRAAKQRAGGLT